MREEFKRHRIRMPQSFHEAKRGHNILGKVVAGGMKEGLEVLSREGHPCLAAYVSDVFRFL
jgi:hypothetical protein